MIDEIRKANPTTADAMQVTYDKAAKGGGGKLSVAIPAATSKGEPSKGTLQFRGMGRYPTSVYWQHLLSILKMCSDGTVADALVKDAANVSWDKESPKGQGALPREEIVAKLEAAMGK